MTYLEKILVVQINEPYRMLERTLNKDDKNGNYLARNLNVILQVAYTVTIRHNHAQVHPVKEVEATLQGSPKRNVNLRG